MAMLNNQRVIFYQRNIQGAFLDIHQATEVLFHGIFLHPYSIQCFISIFLIQMPRKARILTHIVFYKPVMISPGNYMYPLVN